MRKAHQRDETKYLCPVIPIDTEPFLRTEQLAFDISGTPFADVKCMD